MTSKRLIAIHLLNDRSGSPLVFRQALEALQESGFAISLFTATPTGSGFLSNLEGITTYPLRYNWSPSKLMTLWNYLSVQLHLFATLLFMLRSTDQVYINTLLPFGAALAGWLRGCRVVYHVHEVSITPWLLKAWLRGVANVTASQALFVSAYTRQQTALTKPDCRLIYNALPEVFTEQASQIEAPNTLSTFTALMLCSNKAYKGIHEFVAAARQLPHVRFLLILNDNEAGVHSFVRQSAPPANCFIYPAQADTLSFYKQAHIVLNLSQPDAWVETFGMTVLEAMACGRPVIVPPVGGVCELITEGREGFRVDGRKLPILVRLLRQLSSDMTLYRRMAQAARDRSASFSASTFHRQINAVFMADYKVAMPVEEPILG